jgi:hypothetical protein
MKDNKYDHIYYNPIKFQDITKADDVLTCGRHALTRILLRDLNLDDYKAFLEDVMKENNIKTYDGAVSYLTRNIDEQH